MRRTLLLAALTFSGCETDAVAPQEKVALAPTKLAGIYPERFECTTIATLDALTQILGSPTRAIDSPSSVPRGLPRPCTYEVAATPPEYWTFDFDCRDGYKRRADDLFDQYRKYNADRIAQYNGMADAGVRQKPSDAGTAEFRQPGLPTDVEVGAKGLDHNDQGLIFIDDDAPCYVRIIGPEATRRLALARLIAKNLSFANAPMAPRPFPK
ncbi:MAG: hypothetical protein H6Q90_2740 [Deltaproteobacteria bacterium]|nr:hypothetical protein [Deltaproteobacteria bacterium]